MDLIEEVLKKIAPSPQERNKIERIVAETQTKIMSEIKKLKLDADVVLVGSIAKDTYINNTDIDFFVRFSKEYEELLLKKYIIKIGSSIFKNYDLKYAQHPYVSGKIEEIDVELVPCYKIDTPAQKISTVDRTPFHTEFILNNLKDSQKNEVRLLKAFLKSIDIYGAEAKVEGFSGYLSELLILKYGTFINLLKESTNWCEYTVLEYNVDIDEKYKKELIKKFDSPLIYIDPVDNNRNVAAALSRTNYSIFKFAAMSFLKNPSLSFFFRKERKMSFTDIIEKIRARGSKIIILKMPRPDLVDDILYPQIYRLKKIIGTNLGDFGIINIFYSVTKLHIFIIIESSVEKISKVIKHEGPPLWSKNIADFIEKWKDNENVLKGPFIENDRLYVDLRNDQYLLAKKLKYELGQSNIGKNLDFLKHKAEIYNFKEGIRMIPISDLYNMFDYKFPWEY
ncbi:MAG: CCA tRNA nucleotidyltransferase [Thermoplasmata archaeon]